MQKTPCRRDAVKGRILQKVVEGSLMFKVAVTHLTLLSMKVRHASFPGFNIFVSIFDREEDWIVVVFSTIHTLIV